jgi:hypothetical protein
VQLIIAYHCHTQQLEILRYYILLEYFREKDAEIYSDCNLYPTVLCAPSPTPPIKESTVENNSPYGLAIAPLDVWSQPHMLSLNEYPPFKPVHICISKIQRLKAHQ